MTRSIVGLVAATLLLGAPSAAAAATNLILDGGFEGGPGTLQDPGPWARSLWGIVNEPTQTHSGNWDANTGCTGAACVDPASANRASISQTIQGLTAGHTYTLSFFSESLLQNGGNLDTTLKVLWGNTVITTQEDQPQGYQRFNFDLLATGASETLTFLGRGGFASVQLDDVSLFDITDGGGAGGVPEPGSWALMIGGLGITGLMIRRRRAEALN